MSHIYRVSLLIDYELRQSCVAMPNGVNRDASHQSRHCLAVKWPLKLAFLRIFGTKRARRATRLNSERFASVSAARRGTKEIIPPRGRA